MLTLHDSRIQTTSHLELCKLRPALRARSSGCSSDLEGGAKEASCHLLDYGFKHRQDKYDMQGFDTYVRRSPILVGPLASSLRLQLENIEC